ncbi:MAG: hypothetical protein OXG72_08800 [Acidobacteria bacterium]|nr:hypothetical protein [Acidobacteriota bacterium]
MTALTVSRNRATSSRLGTTGKDRDLFGNGIRSLKRHRLLSVVR